MSLYVIDASVAVKWAFKEYLCFEAVRYMDDGVQRISPDLILHECNAAAQKKVWRNEISAEIAWRGYELIFQGESIQLFDSRSLIESAYRLAVELNHAVYDCYYLALAQQKNAVVVTADRKFYERVKASDYAHVIAWVAEAPK